MSETIHPKGVRWTRGALAIVGVGALALTGCTAGGTGGAGETAVRPPSP